MSAELAMTTDLARHDTSHLEIDLDAVASNTRLVASRTSGTLMAVVKSDGFGHGAAAVAATALAHGATSLGVATMTEALALRDEGFEVPVLSWLNTLDADLAAGVLHDVDVAVPSAEHLEAVARAAATVGRAARVHLHADTGMARDGAPERYWPDLCRAARELSDRRLLQVVGLMGHLPLADRGNPAANEEGREAFSRFREVAGNHGLSDLTHHLAATSATLTDPATHHDMSRVGAALIGIDPTGATRLRPAMTLTAPVIDVRDVDAGTGVGYDHTHVVTARTRLVQLGIGYADGIPRAATGRADVVLHGRRCAVVGRVSMDQIVVDVGDLPVRRGDVAVVMGPGRHGEPTMHDWARWSGSIPHEIVTGFGPRVVRTTLPAAPAPTSLRALP